MYAGSCETRQPRSKNIIFKVFWIAAVSFRNAETPVMHNDRGIIFFTAWGVNLLVFRVVVIVYGASKNTLKNIIVEYWTQVQVHWTIVGKDIKSC